MLNITDKSLVTDHATGRNLFKKIVLKPDDFDSLVEQLVALLPDHYIDPLSVASTLERLGKPAAAQKLRLKLPEVKKIRSGDIGEIITTDYIEEKTPFTVPIRNLRWKDHRNMAMRGDDVIKLENILHRFFDSAKLDIQINDRFGKPVTPREWFLVPLFIVDEVVEKIKDGSISEYKYDSQRVELVEV